MKLVVGGLSGPVLSLANAVQRAFDELLSPPQHIFATSADLPKPDARSWQGRTVIVRDLGGSPGFATALDGVWYDQSWSPI